MKKRVDETSAASARREEGSARTQRSKAPRAMRRARARARRGAATGALAGLLLSTSMATLFRPAPAAASPAPPAANTFPIPTPYRVSFTNDWHACRDGCDRLHKGNDIFAEEGAPFVAVEPGVITRSDETDNSISGRNVWLRGDSGVSYFYAHNAENLVSAGQRVAKGQIIGRVGRTGNARGTPAHIHFQVNVCGDPSSSEPCTVNPYQLLRSWRQGEVDGGADAVGLYRKANDIVELRADGGSALPPAAFPPGVGEAVLPVAGDWDGDGRDTIGAYRRSDGTFVDASGSHPVVLGAPGATDVLPVAGDWDGDGRDTVGAYRRSDSSFVLLDGEGRSTPAVVFGPSGRRDTFPVAADWDGDGRDSLGVFDQATGAFLRRGDDGSELSPVVFDAAGPRSLPLVGDWDGDGRDTVGAYGRDGGFHLSGPDLAHPALGAVTIAGDPDAVRDAFPVAGDWNGRDLVTLEDLRAIFGPLPDEAAVVGNLPLLNTEMRNAGMTTPSRKAAFLASMRESGFRPATAWSSGLAHDVGYAADRLDMAAVNIARGDEADAAEDAARCSDFQKALAWFSGGHLPAGVNCDRSRAVEIPPRPVWSGTSPAHEAPSRPAEAEELPPSTPAPVGEQPPAPATVAPPTSGEPVAVPPAVPTEPPPPAGGEPLPPPPEGPVVAAPAAGGPVAPPTTEPSTGPAVAPEDGAGPAADAQPAATPAASPA